MCSDLTKIVCSTEGFFYETVAPILSVGNASLVAISTLTSEINFYTRLIKMHDPATDRPLFVTRCIELCCEKCKEEGRQAECNHLLHLVPSWQSEERHRKLKVMMQDRPVCYVHIVFLVCLRRHTGPTVAWARRTECTGPWCWGSSWRLTSPCARCCLCQCCVFFNANHSKF